MDLYEENKMLAKRVEELGNKWRLKFAGMALQAILSTYQADDVAFPKRELAAKLAFEYADAMLEASKRPSEKGPT